MASLNEHEFEQAPGDGEGQGSLVCYSPWGCRVRHDIETEQLQQRIKEKICSQRNLALNTSILVGRCG